jgi:hypothetical protein
MLYPIWSILRAVIPWNSVHGAESFRFSRNSSHFTEHECPLRLHKSLPLIPTMSEEHPFSYLSLMHVQANLFSFPGLNLCAFYFHPCVLHFPPIYYMWFDNPKDVCRKLHFIKLLILHICSASCKIKKLLVLKFQILFTYSWDSCIKLSLSFVMCVVIYTYIYIYHYVG